MEEQIISFEAAKLAKKYGFDEKLPMESYEYTEDGSSYWCLAIPLAKAEMETFKAPTQSFLQKWLREKHGIYVSVDCKNTIIPEDNFHVEVTYKDEREYTHFGDDKTYEESLERGLIRALKLLEDNETT